MELRKESVFLPVPHPCRILHISDVHFSARTTHEQNLRTITCILQQVMQCVPFNAVCITGDLVSRKVNQDSLPDAALLVQKLRQALPYGEILYSMGNHEMDLPAETRESLCAGIRHAGAAILDNGMREAFASGYGKTDDGFCFVGLTLPQDVYRLPNGSYLGLPPITHDMVKSCLGKIRPHKPCILLAHSPLGLSAYAEWGADLVLSGHVHGGIVRIGNTGLLSPERRFLPRYTKGMFSEQGCTMNVSAGIGKLRINNPAEVVCIDVLPEERK